jgi:hypothetical protein
MMRDIKLMTSLQGGAAHRTPAHVESDEAICPE